MSPKELIAHYRSQSAAAAALGCAQSTVAEWVAAGSIPDGRQYQAELATRGRLKADRPALRARKTRSPQKEPTKAGEVSHG